MTARHTPSGQIAPPERVADGTHPGTERLIGQRVVVAYPYYHTRKGEQPTIETRYAFGKVVSILPGGALWVVTDREGGMRVRAECAEVVE